MAGKTEIAIGDLVEVDGYPGRLFYVDAYVVERHHTHDGDWTETWYDLTCAHGVGLYEMAEATDVRRVCGPDQADDYLMYHAPTPPAGLNAAELADAFGMIFTGEGAQMATQEPRKPTARELSAQEAERRKQARRERAAKIDALLDEMNDLRVLAEMCGDDSGEYAERVAQIKAELTELGGEYEQDGNGGEIRRRRNDDESMDSDSF